MDKVFKRGVIEGVITAPSSKSSMQRAVAASLLSPGESTITNASFCNDSVAAMGMAEAMGATVHKDNANRKVVVRGGLDCNGGNRILNCGESGLGIRMFSAVAALCSGKTVMSGSGSLKKRPMGMIEDALKMLGATVRSENGTLPLEIEGPIVAGNYRIDGSLSSQFISGLLFALPCLEGDSELTVVNTTSKPYIDMTLNVLSHYGVEIEHENYSTFYIRGGQQYKPTHYRVEGDWSGASFLLVLGAIGGPVTVKGLDIESAQADKRIIDALKLAGAKVTIINDHVAVIPAPLKSFTFDISESPDLAPPLAVLAAACKGKSVITGTGRLNIKESDRGANLESELLLLGADVRNMGDRIEIYGKGVLNGGRVKSFNDHRIAMAMAICSSISEGDITIDDIDCINKSYPAFIDDYIKTGGVVADRLEIKNETKKI